MKRFTKFRIRLKHIVFISLALNVLSMVLLIRLLAYDIPDISSSIYHIDFSHAEYQLRNIDKTLDDIESRLGSIESDVSSIYSELMYR